MDSEGVFDVTIGGFDSCQICDLCGIYLLSEVSKFIPQASHGLYRDDGILALRATGREMDQIRQKLEKMFRENGLKIVVVVNVKVTEFLDVKLDLNTRKFRPFRKPRDVIKYVNYNSNHPPATLKSLPSNIENRLTGLSCNEQVFNEEKVMYQQALKNSNYNYTLKYNPKPSKKKKRRRTRDIVWFNPPWSKNVKTPIAKLVLKAVDHFFPKETHDLAKWLNRNYIKVSYRTTKNLKAYVNSHNQKLLNKKEQEKPSCNCRKKHECPLEGKCSASNLIYQADVVTEEKGKEKSLTYFGQTMRKFKERYYEHTMAIKNEKSQARLQRHFPITSTS